MVTTKLRGMMIFPQPSELYIDLMTIFFPFERKAIGKLVVKCYIFPKSLYLLHFPSCYNPSMGAALTLEQQMCSSRLSELSVSSVFHSHSASQSILFMTWPSEDSLG